MTPQVPQGVVVSIQHFRYAEDINGRGIPRPTWLLRKLGIRPSPRGGITIAELTFPYGARVVGEAICNLSDNFNKRLGRTISIGRAMERAEQEGLVWSEPV